MRNPTHVSERRATTNFDLWFLPVLQARTLNSTLARVWFTRLFADVSAQRGHIPERDYTESRNVASSIISSMSRRKQAKPQHLKSDEEPAMAGVIPPCPPTWPMWWLSRRDGSIKEVNAQIIIFAKWYNKQQITCGVFYVKSKHTYPLFCKNHDGIL